MTKAAGRRSALVLDCDTYSSEGLRLLCQELGFDARLVRSLRDLRPDLHVGVDLMILDTAFAKSAGDEDRVAALIARVAAARGAVLILADRADWRAGSLPKRVRVVVKPVTPAALAEAIAAFQFGR